MTEKVQLSIYQDNKSYNIEADKGTNLLQVLRENNFKIVAPCGGFGSCGKCKVHIKGKGEVLSCLTTVDESIEVLLPNRQKMRVLESQHKYKAYYPLNPGNCANLASLPYGVAVDIGTTTMVFYLINLVTGQHEGTQSLVNPQTQYGGDVISRISFATQNDNGGQTMQQLLIDASNKQITKLAKQAGITNHQIVKLVYTANTTMLHFLAGIDTHSIGVAPYKAQFTDKKIIKPQELGIAINSEAEIHLMPSISAFVGADIVSGMASLNMPAEIKNYIFLDIGTNGEMALITPNKTFCCAMAAGPAFEGANISCGMAAQNGAIDKVTNDNYTTIGQFKPTGICGSGLIDLIAVLLDKQLIDSQGVLTDEYILANQKESGNGEVVSLTQQDIREVQLAKSAITAGMYALAEKANIKFTDIDALVLAGGFGNYIRTKSAVRIGLFPKEFEDKVIPVGNAAGTGAQMYLQSIDFEAVAEKTRKGCEYIELFEIESFVVEYANQMAFPKE